MQRLKQLGALFVAGALTACGGGGGGGSTSASDLYSGSTEQVAVTSSNANTVAASVVNMELMDTASSGLADVVTLSATDEASKPTFSGVSSELIRKALNLSGSSSSDKYSITQTQSSTLSCYDASGNPSGSMSSSGNLADPSTITSGDTVSMTFNNCSFGGVLTANGKVSMTFNQYSGDVENMDNYNAAQDYAFSATVSYEQFKVTYTNGGLSGQTLIHGGSTMNRSKSGGTESGRMTGSSLYMKEVDGSVTNEMLLSNFDISYTYDGTILTEDANYTIATTDIGGTITVATTQSIETYASANYPHAGQVVISGANGGKVRITAYDTSYTYVKVEVDADGDGTYEFNDPNVLWSELA